MKLELSVLKNFSEKKIPSTLLNKKTLITVRGLSMFAYETNAKPLFLPFLKTIFNKFSKIMINRKHCCKLINDKNWCSINFKQYQIQNNQENYEVIKKFFVFCFLCKKSKHIAEIETKGLIESNNKMHILGNSYSSSTSNNIYHLNDKCDHDKSLNVQMSNGNVNHKISDKNNTMLIDNKAVLECNNNMQLPEEKNYLPPAELKRKKRKKKNNQQSKNQCTNLVNQNRLECKQKKNKKKNKKRQRNFDRDNKDQFRMECNTDDSTLEHITRRNSLMSSNISVSPPNILPPKRTRHLSECSNDSFDICFIDEEDEDENYNLKLICIDSPNESDSEVNATLSDVGVTLADDVCATSADDVCAALSNVKRVSLFYFITLYSKNYRIVPNKKPWYTIRIYAF